MQNDREPLPDPDGSPRPVKANTPGFALSPRTLLALTLGGAVMATATGCRGALPPQQIDWDREPPPVEQSADVEVGTRSEIADPGR